MIPVSHADSGPEGAKLAVKRANIFRQAVSTDFLEKLNNDKDE